MLDFCYLKCRQIRLQPLIIDEKPLENLSNASFEESRDKNFETIRVFEMLCEVSRKLMSTRENTLRKNKLQPRKTTKAF